MPLTSGGYRPRVPEQGVLHTVVRTHLKAFLQEVANRTNGSGLPRFVVDEFREFLTCGVLAEGFARFQCDGCGLNHLLPLICYAFCTSFARVEDRRPCSDVPGAGRSYMYWP